MSYLLNAFGSPTQREPLPGQVANSAGGYSYPVDDWTRLGRFLVLGSEGGSYYASERKLTRENTAGVERCIGADGLRVVRETLAVSEKGRAPKNDHAIMVLAMCAKLGDEATRKAAHGALPDVCRIGTHLYHWAAFVNALGGWGRGSRNAVARWFNNRSPSDLAHQLTKYQQRDGWSARDLLRLSHPVAASKDHAALYDWACHGTIADFVPGILAAHEAAKKATSTAEICGLIRDAGLPRESIPSNWLTEAAVWEALLEKMPITATIRNLGVMSKCGLLVAGAAASKTVEDRVTSEELLTKGRVHPIHVLTAMLTYKAGHGVKGASTWTAVTSVVDALDAAFYKSFGSVEPTGKRTVLALDVSGSMANGTVAGVPGLTPRIASVAMAMITAAVETSPILSGFASTYCMLDVSPRRRLDDNCAAVGRLPFGGTDCSLPMRHAEQHDAKVDTFVVYTDSETWHGDVHPSDALRSYRRRTGIPAKLVVVGLVSNGFSIADPDDGGMLDVVGFDTAAPGVISDFSRGPQ